MAGRKKLLFEGGLHHWLEKLFDAVMLDILWAVFSLPLVTLGASTAALYHGTVKVLRGGQGYAVREFVKSFKLNFAKGTLIWIVFAALLFILIVNRNIAADIGGVYLSLFLICLYTFLFALVALTAFYSMAVLSRFEMGMVAAVKLALYMCFRYPHYSLGIAAILALACAAVYYLPPLVFIAPVGACVFVSYLMEKLLIRHTPLDGGSEHKWYVTVHKT